jgi:hypothetical protein
VSTRAAASPHPDRHPRCAYALATRGQRTDVRLSRDCERRRPAAYARVGRGPSVRAELTPTLGPSERDRPRRQPQTPFCSENRSPNPANTRACLGRGVGAHASRGALALSREAGVSGETPPADPQSEQQPSSAVRSSHRQGSGISLRSWVTSSDRPLRRQAVTGKMCETTFIREYCTGGGWSRFPYKKANLGSNPFLTISA